MVKKLKKVPKIKRLIGHTVVCDVYEAKNGGIWHYYGTEKEHWNNPNFWEKVGFPMAYIRKREIKPYPNKIKIILPKNLDRIEEQLSKKYPLFF